MKTDSTLMLQITIIGIAIILLMGIFQKRNEKQIEANHKELLLKLESTRHPWSEPLDLSAFDTSEVVDIFKFMTQPESLKALDTRAWDVSFLDEEEK